MERDTGNIKFPIWIIGDSEPDRWKDSLSTPFDPRHPIRHNIITSVFDVVQDSIFRNSGKRVDTSKIYIRNAVSEASSKPARNELLWNIKLNNEIMMLKSLLSKNNPVLILTFGAFAYEFTRRAFDKEVHKYNYWTTERLGDEFRKNTSNMQGSNPIIIPLLHRSIAGGHFIKSHENYCKNIGANYFDFVGTEIANVTMKILYDSDIWVTISKTN
ncbi:hypothetical protein BCD91_004405 [Clostridium beijerinckii]|uniref:hypothetical protein n=1 Tax=Clostridium TaxID=1485 RepID=UPI001494D844|nr:MULTISPECIES: hypothetical protein [Clostridium]NOW92382.1 hypothetical protein [Clostridium beijerinckii]